MKTRLFAMGLAVLSAALVACGGGGGGYTPPSSTPTPVPTATATPTATPASFGCVGQAPFTASSRRIASVPHPTATGDAFTYTGTLNKTYWQSAPCPEPTSATSATVGITVTNTVSSNTAFGQTDAQSVETDTFPTQTVKTTTDQVVQVTGNAPKQLYQMFNTTTTDTNGNLIQTLYTNPQTLDNVPEIAGSTWSNSPQASLSETLADGSMISRTIASDGSYIDTQTYPGGISANISVNGAATAKPLDGSGSYSFAGATFSYAAPVNGSITLTISGSGTKTRTFPQWFTVPAGGSYITDTFADNGSQTIPASCGASSVAPSGEQIVETYAVLDPVLGYTDKRITTSYVVDGYGAACVVINDTMNSYYDYADDTTRIDYQSQNGQPNSVDTISETLGMQTAKCASGGTGPCSALRRPQSVHGVSALAVAMRISAIEHERSVQRATKLQRLHAFAMQFVGHHGGFRK